MEKVTLKIDGVAISVEPQTTILQAACLLNIEIPTLCYSKVCGPGAACMVCAVRELTSQQTVAACATSCQSGMDIDTNSDFIRHFRRAAVELLLSEHRGACEALCRTVCPQFLDIPSLVRSVLVGKQPSIVYDREICNKCGGKCESACRRGRYDHAVKICELLAEHARKGEGQSSIARQYNHLYGRITQEDLQDMVRQLPQTASSAEAARCMQCDCKAKDHCRLRDLATEYEAKQRVYKNDHPPVLTAIDAGEIIFTAAKCVKCGRCVRIGEKLKPGHGPVMAFRGALSKITPPIGAEYKDAFAGFAKEFSDECPTGALALKTKQKEEEEK